MSVAGPYAVAANTSTIWSCSPACGSTNDWTGVEMVFSPDDHISLDKINVSVTSTGNLSLPTFTRSSTPRGILVIVDQNASSSDQVSGVTYGGVSMTEITGSPNQKSGGETSALYGYFLGSGIPTGTQSVTTTVSAASQKRMYVIAFNAGGDTEVIDSDVTVNSASQANPSSTLSLSSRIAYAVTAFHSGQDSTNNVTPFANWGGVSGYSFNQESIWGTQTGGIYGYNFVDTNNVNAGWTQTAEDAAGLFVAISQVESAAATPSTDDAQVIMVE